MFPPSSYAHQLVLTVGEKGYAVMALGACDSLPWRHCATTLFGLVDAGLMDQDESIRHLYDTGTLVVYSHLL